MSTQLAYSVDHATPFPPSMVAPSPWTKMPGERSERGSALGMAGAVLHFGQDREIYSEGADADLFFKVVSGVVRTCKFLSDGRRQIDAFYKAGDVFGFELGGQHGLWAEAVCDCTLVSYRRRGLETLAANDGGLMAQLFSYAMQSLARAQEHALLLGRRSATEKVAAFLIDCVDESAGGKIVNLAMTRQDIADYLGLTIETVSRTLSQLERDALIEIPAARQIHLKNPSALRELNA
jgi:CRP/FNR family transcriptional regulator, nitrogen fixation regulation protein